LNGHFQRRTITILTFWAGLVGYIDQAQAQFGASGARDLPTFLVFAPWIILLIALFGARWLRPVRRSRLYTAVRRAVAVYLFIETVPITVCLLLVAIFNVGQSVGLTFWVVSMMGVIFSGPVLLVFISLALTLDWVVSLLRRPWRSMRR
jgi:hypothetical protein